MPITAKRLYPVSLWGEAVVEIIYASCDNNHQNVNGEIGIFSWNHHRNFLENSFLHLVELVINFRRNVVLIRLYQVTVSRPRPNSNIT